MDEAKNEGRQQCPVCKKWFSNLGSHMKAHKSEESVTDEAFNEFTEVDEVPSPSVSPEDRLKNTFNVKEEEGVPEIPLKDFLVEEQITYKQLKELIDRGKDGTALNVKEELKRKLAKGDAQANTLKDQDVVETSDINVCDSLVKNYGYTAQSVKGGGGKKWILRKTK